MYSMYCSGLYMRNVADMMANKRVKMGDILDKMRKVQ
jgi:hypothetical protein